MADPTEEVVACALASLDMGGREMTSIDHLTKLAQEGYRRQAGVALAAAARAKPPNPLAGLTVLARKPSPDENEAGRAYREGRWCGECRFGVVEDPPCCTQPATEAARANDLALYDEIRRLEHAGYQVDGLKRLLTAGRSQPAPELTDKQVDAWLRDRLQVRVTCEVARQVGLPL